MFTRPSFGQVSARSSDRASATKANGSVSTDIRAEMISRAKDLLAVNAGGKYGAEDLAGILKNLIPALGWASNDGLKVLKKNATSVGALDMDGYPEAGDIVLFHNQVDANGNGKLDDQLTGCGIVVDDFSKGFEAVARTGNTPRLIRAWPTGPSRDQINGKKINSFIRIPKRSDPVETEYLAGQLYAGHINIEILKEAAK